MLKDNNQPAATDSTSELSQASQNCIGTIMTAITDMAPHGTMAACIAAMLVERYSEK